MGDTLGARVRHYRRLHKLTMEELGALIETSHSYISQMESNKMVPGSDVLAKVARVLKVSSDTLLGIEKPPNEVVYRLEQVVSELALDNPLGVLECLRSLPENEQRILARLIRLSAQDHAEKAPKQLRVNEERTDYKAQEEG